jgi:hypothetical protein
VDELVGIGVIAARGLISGLVVAIVLGKDDATLIL